ncbi:MAG: YceI family protein [Acidimicrobiia bacterium]|nr:YceI family protein [Acidimicrobiia bacterium]
MSIAPVQVPGLTAGTWVFDLAHSEVSFTVRHLMVSKVRGLFTKFEGQIQVADDLLASSVEASIDLSSIDTRDANRDTHLRSADFFEIEKYPTMTYKSTAVRAVGDHYVVDGDLTLHGVTKSVPLTLEFNGVSGDPWGGTRAGFSAETEINRKDFGIDISMPLDGGGVVVGDKIKVAVEIEAVLSK